MAPNVRNYFKSRKDERMTGDANNSSSSPSSSSSLFPSSINPSPFASRLPSFSPSKTGSCSSFLVSSSVRSLGQSRPSSFSTTSNPTSLNRHQSINHQSINHKSTNNQSINHQRTDLATGSAMSKTVSSCSSSPFSNSKNSSPGYKFNSPKSYFPQHEVTRCYIKPPPVRDVRELVRDVRELKQHGFK